MEALTPILIVAGRFILVSALLMALYRATYCRRATHRAKRAFLTSLPAVALLIALLHVTLHVREDIVVEREVVSVADEAPASAGLPAAEGNHSAESDPLSTSNPSPTVRLNTAEEPTVPTEAEAGAPASLLTVLPSLHLPTVAVWAYLLVAFLLSLPLAVSLFRLRHLRKGARVEHDEAQGVCIVTGAHIDAPFSCHRTIYLPQHLTATQRRMILCHEQAHIRYRHYREVWLVEAMTRLLWFNPVMWWLRGELRNVHEYEADSEVLATGEDRYAYQTILLEEVMNGDLLIANGFNHSFIRRRFIEMFQSSNRCMSRLAKAGSAAWVLLVVALFCFRVGEARVVYVDKVVSQATDKAPVAEATAVASEPLAPTEAPAPAEEPALTEVSAPAVVLNETEKTEVQADTLSAEDNDGWVKAISIGPVPPEKWDSDLEVSATRISDEAKAYFIPMSLYRQRAENDTVARRNYELLVACTEKAKRFRAETLADYSLSQAEAESRIKQFTEKTFDEADIVLVAEGGYYLPDGTLVKEDSQYQPLSATGGEEAQTESLPPVLPNLLPCAILTRLEYTNMTPKYRLVRYPNETHLIYYVCPTQTKEQIVIDRQATLTDPETGDRYMLRRVEEVPDHVRGVMMYHYDGVVLQMTYVFPPLGRNMKKVKVSLPAYGEEKTHRVKEIEMLPVKEVSDHRLRALCDHPQTEGKDRPANAAPVMERDKSANYDAQNEHTFPVYSSVFTVPTQVFHNESGHFSVYRGKECTYVVSTYRVRWDWHWFTFSDNEMLIDPKTGTRYRTAGTEFFPLNTRFWVYGQKGQYIRFVSIFPPLPDG